MTTSGSEDGMTIGTNILDDEPDVADYDDEAGDTSDDNVTVDSKEGRNKRSRVNRIFAFGVLPGLALVLAMGAGYSKWQVDSVRDSDTARMASVQAATESTIAILSYQPDSAEKELNAARDRLAEPFRDEYSKLITDVVIPGAKEKNISAIATVPAAASVSATSNSAEVLLFIDQSIVIGTDAPTSTASTVRVTLQKDRDRWLISQFDPV
jgi:Mce-associated membrane protein